MRVKPGVAGTKSSFKISHLFGFLLIAVVGVGMVYKSNLLLSHHTHSPDVNQKTTESAQPIVNAWISPPGFTGQSPIMLTSADEQKPFFKSPIDVPEGSVFSVHIQGDGPAPRLELNGRSFTMKRDEHGDYFAAETLTQGNVIALNRSWHELGSWKIRLIPDTVPQIAFTDQPSVTENKTTRFSYEAFDDHGIQSVAIRITPTSSIPGQNNKPIDIIFAAPQAKQVKQLDFQDFTFLPWAGMPVEIKLIATDAAGHIATSDPKIVTLPERQFNHPLARALIEERKKLQGKPDEMTLDEAASIMAGIARQPASFRGDPVVMLSLRSGAVRLVLSRDKESVAAVNQLLWQVAVRIEEGALGLAQNNLRQAQRDLASALDRNDSNESLQHAVAHVQHALGTYMEELTAHLAQQPSTSQETGFVVGPEKRLLMTADLQNMLKALRNLPANGPRDVLRQQLMRLQQTVESIRTTPPDLSPELQQSFRKMAAFRSLARAQQLLLDLLNRTEDTKSQKDISLIVQKVTEEQKGLLTRLQRLTTEIGAVFQGSEAIGAAMNDAVAALQKSKLPEAKQKQEEIIAALDKGLQAMMEQMRNAMLALSDPTQTPAAAPSAPKNPDVPPPLERTKDSPKASPDYIDRLLKRLQ